MITNEIHVVYTETKIGNLDHARGGGAKGSHMGKGHKAGVSVYFGHMSSFFFKKGALACATSLKGHYHMFMQWVFFFFMKIHIYFMF